MLQGVGLRQVGVGGDASVGNIFVGAAGGASSGVMRQISSDAQARGLGAWGTELGVAAMGAGGRGHLTQFNEGLAGMGGVGGVGGVSGLGNTGASVQVAASQASRPAMLSEEDLDFLTSCAAAARLPAVPAPEAGQMLSQADREWLLQEAKNVEGSAEMDLQALQVPYAAPFAACRGASAQQRACHVDKALQRRHAQAAQLRGLHTCASTLLYVY